MPVADVALMAKEMCQRYGVPPQAAAHHAAGIRNEDGVSVVDSFAENGVYFREAGKGSRIGGRTHMREMLVHAWMLDRAGLYVSDACRYFWQTVPFLSGRCGTRRTVTARSIMARTRRGMDAFRSRTLGHRGSLDHRETPSFH